MDTTDVVAKLTAAEGQLADIETFVRSLTTDNISCGVQTDLQLKNPYCWLEESFLANQLELMKSKAFNSSSLALDQLRTESGQMPLSFNTNLQQKDIALASLLCSSAIVNNVHRATNEKSLPSASELVQQYVLQQVAMETACLPKQDNSVHEDIMRQSELVLQLVGLNELGNTATVISWRDVRKSILKQLHGENDTHPSDNAAVGGEKIAVVEENTNKENLQHGNKNRSDTADIDTAATTDAQSASKRCRSPNAQTTVNATPQPLGQRDPKKLALEYEASRKERTKLLLQAFIGKSEPTLKTLSKTEAKQSLESNSSFSSNNSSNSDNSCAKSTSSITSHTWTTAKASERLNVRQESIGKEMINFCERLKLEPNFRLESIGDNYVDELLTSDRMCLVSNVKDALVSNVKDATETDLSLSVEHGLDVSQSECDTAPVIKQNNYVNYRLMKRNDDYCLSRVPLCDHNELRTSSRERLTDYRAKLENENYSFARCEKQQNSKVSKLCFEKNHDKNNYAEDYYDDNQSNYSESCNQDCSVIQPHLNDSEMYESNVSANTCYDNVDLAGHNLRGHHNLSVLSSSTKIDVSHRPRYGSNEETLFSKKTDLDIAQNYDGFLETKERGCQRKSDHYSSDREENELVEQVSLQNNYYTPKSNLKVNSVDRNRTSERNKIQNITTQRNYSTHHENVTSESMDSLNAANHLNEIIHNDYKHEQLTSLYEVSRSKHCSNDFKMNLIEKDKKYSKAVELNQVNGHSELRSENCNRNGALLQSGKRTTGEKSKEVLPRIDLPNKNTCATSSFKNKDPMILRESTHDYRSYREDHKSADGDRLMHAKVESLLDEKTYTPSRIYKPNKENAASVVTKRSNEKATCDKEFTNDDRKPTDIYQLHKTKSTNHASSLPKHANLQNPTSSTTEKPILRNTSTEIKVITAQAKAGDWDKNLMASSTDGELVVTRSGDILRRHGADFSREMKICVDLGAILERQRLEEDTLSTVDSSDIRDDVTETGSVIVNDVDFSDNMQPTPNIDLSSSHDNRFAKRYGIKLLK